jgi:hypothetical protein
MKRSIGLILMLISLSIAAFAQSGGVKGKVIVDSNDKSLSGVEITASQDGKDVKTATSDSKGGFYIDGLADGIYTLTFDKDGYSKSSIKFEVKKSKITDLSNRRLGMQADRGGMVTIQGAVFDQDGFSLPGAKVEIARLTSGNVWEKLKAIYSSQDGEFIFRFPPASKETNYRLTVTYKNAEPQVKEKSTDFAGIYRLAFNLPVKRQP